ncbi:COG5377 Phage-related protein, predicted endonuclease [uncultured Caudovirales phage]|uniref:COG5377 Phage-related protein, predicted endonuclease n=1 Tax=uncultured Caudovirales phage TaxID=2100421 RepID=A0A6J5R761_9CAUD|nr:COG5377 Phage-related protein, predicted endonuclease [uncultured Caudovirales phage]
MSKQYEFVKAQQRSPEWFALRQDGITATEVSVIAGLNPYKTPYQLWAEKLGKYQPEPAGAAAQRGIILEDAVATFYEMETGSKLKRSNGIVRLKEIPWAMASLDRTVVGEAGLVEIKTSASPRWSMFPVPPEVVAQVQWQMFVTGAPWCDVAVLLGGLVFRTERVKADTKYQTELYVKAEEFRKLLASGTPPALTGADSKALATVTPQDSEEWAQADDGIERVARLYSERTYELKLLEQEVDNLAIAIKESIGAKQGIVGQGWQATWRQNKASVKTDWRTVAEVLQGVAPDTYAEAVKSASSENLGARVFKYKQEGIGE